MGKQKHRKFNSLSLKKRKFPMKRSSLVGALASVSLLCGVLNSVASAETYSVDTVHSALLFRVKHAGTSNAWGRFNDVTGTVTAKDGVLSGIDIKVKADSVDTANGKRDEHLKGPDFFNTKQFPEISFKSTKVKKLDDTTFEVTGDLTLHGVTNPTTVKLTKTGSGNMKGKDLVGYDTNFKIKRSDFEMKQMIGPLGDEVFLIVSLECASAGK
jgi:polyisoprenoid-binding protein YceI